MTTLIGIDPVPHSPGCVGMSLFRKTLVAGVASLFVASLAEAAPFGSWSYGQPAYSPPAYNPPARKTPARAAVVNNKGKKNDESKNPFGDMPKGPLQMVVSIGQPSSIRPSASITPFNPAAAVRSVTTARISAKFGSPGCGIFGRPLLPK